MKLAWICITKYEEEFENEVELKFEEPERWKYDEIIPIVYAELEREG